MPDPITILYCIERMGHGGTEKQLAGLIRRLDRTAFRPLLCTLRPSFLDLTSIGCPVLELPFTSFARPSAGRCLTRLHRFIREERVDLIQTFFQDPTVLAFLASLGTGVKARIGSFRDLGFWRTPFKVWQLRRIYPHFDAFIANSWAVARYAHASDGIPLDKITVIYNGVDLPQEAAQSATRRDSETRRPVVGIVANLNRPVKRVDLFLRAAALVKHEVPESEFVVLGDGSLRRDLEQLAVELGIDGAIRFLGNMPDISGPMAGFAVGVLCSESEGLSNALMEYMAAGVPPVARAVGGNPELIGDDMVACLVGSDSPSDLAQPIVALLRDSRLRAAMSTLARETVRTRFSWARCLVEHERFYASLVGRSYLEPDQYDS